MYTEVELQEYML